MDQQWYYDLLELSPSNITCTLLASLQSETAIGKGAADFIENCSLLNERPDSTRNCLIQFGYWYPIKAKIESWYQEKTQTKQTAAPEKPFFCPHQPELKEIIFIIFKLITSFIQIHQSATCFLSLYQSQNKMMFQSTNFQARTGMSHKP